MTTTENLDLDLDGADGVILDKLRGACITSSLYTDGKKKLVPNVEATERYIEFAEMCFARYVISRKGQREKHVVMLKKLYGDASMVGSFVQNLLLEEENVSPKNLEVYVMIQTHLGVICELCKESHKHRPLQTKKRLQRHDSV